MPQKNETKKNNKVRDLKPKKDAKGGGVTRPLDPLHRSPGHSPTAPTGQK